MRIKGGVRTLDAGRPVRALAHAGRLSIVDTTDPGLRQPVKVAHLHWPGMPEERAELLEPHILWADGGRFVLAGFERVRNEAGETVGYSQSWLCAIDTAAPCDTATPNIRR